MERRQEIQRTVFTAVAVDIAVILIFVVAWLNKPHDLVVFATICFPTLFIFNFLFLRRKLKESWAACRRTGHAFFTEVFCVRLLGHLLRGNALRRPDDCARRPSANGIAIASRSTIARGLLSQNRT